MLYCFREEKRKRVTTSRKLFSSGPSARRVQSFSKKEEPERNCNMASSVNALQYSSDSIVCKELPSDCIKLLDKYQLTFHKIKRWDRRPPTIYCEAHSQRIMLSQFYARKTVVVSNSTLNLNNRAVHLPLDSFFARELRPCQRTMRFLTGSHLC